MRPALIFVAVAPVFVGVILASLLDEWDGVGYPLAFLYLGVAALLAATSGVAFGLATALVGLAIVGGLLPASPGLSLGIFRSVRGILAGTAAWRATGFRLRWFDTSVAAMVLVGALGVAAARPILGEFGLDLASDALVCMGLLFCLIGRPARAACGVLSLTLAAGIWLAVTSAEPRLAVGLVSVLQLVLAMVLAHLRSVEEQRAVERDLEAGHERQVGPPLTDDERAR